jgi:hypothetical protein
MTGQHDALERTAMNDCRGGKKQTALGGTVPWERTVTGTEIAAKI